MYTSYNRRKLKIHLQFIPKSKKMLEESWSRFLLVFCLSLSETHTKRNWDPLVLFSICFTHFSLRLMERPQTIRSLWKDRKSSSHWQKVFAKLFISNAPYKCEFDTLWRCMEIFAYVGCFVSVGAFCRQNEWFQPSSFIKTWHQSGQMSFSNPENLMFSSRTAVTWTSWSWRLSSAELKWISPELDSDEHRLLELLFTWTELCLNAALKTADLHPSCDAGGSRLRGFLCWPQLRSSLVVFRKWKWMTDG